MRPFDIDNLMREFDFTLENEYISPISILSSEIDMCIENDILKCVSRYGINIDKEELVKALNYDRDQYMKGYAAGKALSNVTFSEWVWDAAAIDWGIGAWVCKRCHCRNDNIPSLRNENPYAWAGSKFCPECGAKMKGGGVDEVD